MRLLILWREIDRQLEEANSPCAGNLDTIATVAAMAAFALFILLTAIAFGEPT